MVEPHTIPVLESKLRGLEQDHDFLELIREKNREVDELQAAFDEANETAKKCKKALDAGNCELRELIEAGPPKPDAQKRLPFAEDRNEAEAASEPAAESAAEAPQPDTAVVIPAEIAALDISDLQKKRLAAAGAKTIADVIDLGNCNWPNFPEGFASLEGFGPKAVSKLKSLLPSTAPADVADDTGEARTIRIKLLTFSGQSPNLVPGNEYDAVETGTGHAIVQLPGEEPVEFLAHEFEKLEPAKV